VNKNQNDIQQLSLGIQQLSTQLVKVSSGLEKTLVQQRAHSEELYQDMEEKLKLYKAENDRLSKEKNRLEDFVALVIAAKLPIENLERIFSIRSQLSKLGGDELADSFHRFMSMHLGCCGEEGLNEFLATQETFLSLADEMVNKIALTRPADKIAEERKELLEKLSCMFRETMNKGLFGMETEVQKYESMREEIEMNKELISLLFKRELDLDKDSEEAKQVNFRIDLVSSCCSIVGQCYCYEVFLNTLYSLYQLLHIFSTRRLS